MITEDHIRWTFLCHRKGRGKERRENGRKERKGGKKKRRGNVLN
jgi:hypothetical protein